MQRILFGLYKNTKIWISDRLEIQFVYDEELFNILVPLIYKYNIHVAIDVVDIIKLNEFDDPATEESRIKINLKNNYKPIQNFINDLKQIKDFEFRNEINISEILNQFMMDEFKK